MLSLAIGREGQNARLAAKLTGWRIDIRSDQAKPTARRSRPARDRPRRNRTADRGSRRGGGAEAPAIELRAEDSSDDAKPAKAVAEPAKNGAAPPRQADT